ncbi:hypothetical protein HDV05_001102 [Chytridiales sp. JEL 0842]|nr:hypothetical protein HDV05_001102 [Chytridiales sp. JEL 0842]
MEDPAEVTIALTPTGDIAMMETIPDMKAEPEQSMKLALDQNPKTHHIFLSYQSESSKDTLFTKSLQSLLENEVVESSNTSSGSVGLSVFMDTLGKQSMVTPLNKEGWLDVMRRSCAVVPIVSADALRECAGGLGATVLLEWEAALELQKAGVLDVVPVFVGNRVEGTYKPFNLENLDVEVSEYTKQLVYNLSRLQSAFLDPEDIQQELPSLVMQILFYVWPKYRKFWFDMDAIVPESTLPCVQCSADFLESENVDGGCAFHAGFFDGDDFSCCEKTEPCTRGKHRSVHHSDYKYSSFYEWMWSINSEPRMHKEFASISSEDFRLSDGGGAFADCGAVLPAHPTDGNKLYVRLFAGTTENVLFKVFSKADIESLESLSTKDHIGCARGLPVGLKDGQAEAEAHWIKSDGKIIGLTMTCRTATSKKPATTEVRFSFTDHQSGPSMDSATVLSVSSFGELKVPNGDLLKAYPTLPLPKALVQSADATRLNLPALRSPELFESTTISGSSLTLSLHSLKAFQPFQANVDRFAATLVVENGSVAPVIIQKAKGYWRMRTSDNETWHVARIESVEVASNTESFAGEMLPTTVNVNQKLMVLVQLDLPRGDEGSKAAMVWRDHSFLARLGPVLLDVEFECNDGSAVSLTMEYTHSPLFTFPEPRPTSSKVLSRITIDNRKTYDRFTLLVESVDLNSSITATDQADPAILAIHSLSSRQFATVRMLRQAVYMVESQPDFNNMEQDVLLWEESTGGSSQDDCYSWRVYGLVDTGCRRVYALRVDLQCGGDTGPEVSGFVLVPEYGDALVDGCEVGVPVEVKPAAYNLNGMVEMKKVEDFEQPLTPFTPRVKASASGRSSSVLSTSVGVDANAAISSAMMTAMESAMQRVIESRLEAMISAKFDQVDNKLTSLRSGISSLTDTASVLSPRHKSSPDESALSAAVVERLMYLEASLRTMESKMDMLFTTQSALQQKFDAAHESQLLALKQATDASQKAGTMVLAVNDKVQSLEQRVESSSSQILKAIENLRVSSNEQRSVAEPDAAKLTLLEGLVSKMERFVETSSVQKTPKNRQLSSQPSQEELQSLASLASRLESLTRSSSPALGARTDAGLVTTLDALADRLESVSSCITTAPNVQKNEDLAALMKSIEELKQSSSLILKASESVNSAVKDIADLSSLLHQSMQKMFELQSSSNSIITENFSKEISKLSSKFDTAWKREDGEKLSVLIAPEEVDKAKSLMESTSVLESKMSALLTSLNASNFHVKSTALMDVDGDVTLVRSVVPAKAPVLSEAPQSFSKSLEAVESNLAAFSSNNISTDTPTKSFLPLETTHTPVPTAQDTQTSEPASLDPPPAVLFADHQIAKLESRIEALPILIQDTLKTALASQTEVISMLLKSTLETSLDAKLSLVSGISTPPEPTSPTLQAQGGLPRVSVDEGVGAKKARRRSDQ